MQPRGSVADEPVGALLDAAAQDRFGGTIEISGPTRATIHLDRGFVVHLEVAGRGDEPIGPEAVKEQVHGIYARRLALLLDLSAGIYRCEAGTALPSEARWMFGPRALLQSAGQHVRGPRPADRPAPGQPTAGEAGTNRASRAGLTKRVATDDHQQSAPVADLRDELRLDPLHPPRALSASAWRLVVAMADPATTTDLAGRLGWDEATVAAVATELGPSLHRASRAVDVHTQPPGSGVPSDPGEERRHPVAVSGRAPAAAGPWQLPRVAERAAGPALPGRDDSTAATGADSPMRASALRRLISSLR